jgi:hypothetical protein
MNDPGRFHAARGGLDLLNGFAHGIAPGLGQGGHRVPAVGPAGAFSPRHRGHHHAIEAGIRAIQGEGAAKQCGAVENVLEGRGEGAGPGGDGSADAEEGVAGGGEPVFFNDGSAHGAGPRTGEPGEGSLGSEREGEAE